MHIYKNLFGNFFEVCVYLGRLYISQGNRLDGEFFFSLPSSSKKLLIKNQSAFHKKVKTNTPFQKSGEECFH